MFIEFAGMVGAGKSTLVKATEKLLKQRGIAPLTLMEATSLCVERSLVGRAVGRILPRGFRERGVECVSRIVLEPCYAMYFLVSRPRLAWSVLRSQARRDLPLWHRWVILKGFLRLASSFQITRRRLAPDEAVLISEGFLQRAVNLYAWDSNGLDEQGVLDYLRALPVLDLAVVVATPFDLCVERAEKRGLPKRLRTQSPATIEEFMEKSAAIIALTRVELAALRRAFVAIDNGGSLEQSVEQLAQALSIGEPIA